MFIKIACSIDKKSWRWYDADQVQTSKQKYSEWKEDGEKDLELINGPGVNEEIISKYDIITDGDDITLISFVSPDGTGNNIYTDLPVYLLNNNGETIEKLN